jgi:hypothetical protein
MKMEKMIYCGGFDLYFINIVRNIRISRRELEISA